jgi:Domain of unknown function (DUF4920)
MNRVLFVSALLVMGLSVALSLPPKKYGKGLTVKDKTKVSEILSNPQAFDGKKVLVEGAVVDVCKKRGCWIKIGSDKEFESIRFKVEDGVIVFPMTAKGKTALAEGVVSVKTYTKEELIEQGKHQAEEQKTTFDSTTVKGPKTVVQIKGEGAIVK